MTTRFSVQQVLACLNVSVFDPVIEPALKKMSGIKEQESKQQQNPFYNCKLLSAMTVLALVCSYALRPVSLTAGVLLLTICGAALHKTKSYAFRFFLQTYFLSGVFLLTYSMFLLSKPLTVFVLFFFLLRSLFYSIKKYQRTILSGLFFFCVCFAFPDYFFVSLGVFSVLGALSVLYPVKNIYAWETGVVFLLSSLLILLAFDICETTGVRLLLLKSLWSSIFFTLETIILFVCLYHDLEAEEMFSFIVLSVILLLCGIFISIGLQGSLTLFLIAYFIDSPMLGKSSAALSVCFLLLFVLSLPVSLSAAGVIVFGLACLFAILKYRLQRFNAQGFVE